MIRLILLLSIAYSVSCKSTKTPPPEEPTIVVETAANDCYYPRKTILSLSEERGSIGMVGEYYILRDASGDRRLQPCELAQSYRVDSLAVTFSGDILEINPGERRYATPFRLTSIRVTRQ